MHGLRGSYGLPPIRAVDIYRAQDSTPPHLADFNRVFTYSRLVHSFRDGTMIGDQKSTFEPG